MVTTPFRVNHNLGPNLFQVVKVDQVWYEGAEQIGSPQLGDVSQGTDGRRYIWVEASAAVPVIAAPGTQVAVTVNGYDDATAASDATGGYYAPASDFYTGTIAIGDRFWAAQGLAGAA